jgi:ergothioneine biosynthesis protein EgtB
VIIDTTLDRAGLVAWYHRNRARSKALFGLLTEDAYYEQPIALRHPIVFYDGHLPAFSFNTLVKRGLGGGSIDPRLESLFARGIDPPDEAAPRSGSSPHPSGPAWPDRATVRMFVEEADRRVVQALEHADIDQPGHPLLDRAAAAFSILEHEAMHQETLLYMWHRLPFARKRQPHGYAPVVGGVSPAHETLEVAAGRATLGVNPDEVPFAWDNESPRRRVDVDGFSIDRHNVTNERFLEFVEAGGYQDSRWWSDEAWRWITRDLIRHPTFWERQGQDWFWRGMFSLIPLPMAWPVYVSHAEAAAYAAWRGARLPTESEFQRAAFGTPGEVERPFPWGDAPPAPERGVFDFVSWDPQPAGSHPSGRSAWGVDDLLGNGWEWTSTTFAPFPGFRPSPSYPEYSADFFDDAHMVMKGASPVTARELLRPTFRNWFRPCYPYVYATFRCAGGPRSRG